MTETQRSVWVRTAIVTALLVGVMDITYAIGFSYFRSGTPPMRLLQGVASGALGRAAFDGGMPAAAAGLGFHFLIAFTITALYFIAAARVPELVRYPVLTGSAYGIVVYLVMNFVVIPLSRIGARPHPATIVVVASVLVHMFVIGTPIALGARRASRAARNGYRYGRG